MFKERLKFYADTPRGEKNKYFCFDVSIIHLEDAIFRFFAKGFHIRAAWYENINTEYGQVENQKINVQELFDKFCDLPPREKRLYIKSQINSSH